jgi:photosystem II stability/assembly factor-like uncharacterized protein
MNATGMHQRASLARTTDGGAHWSFVDLGRDVWPTTVECPTSSRCVMTGSSGGPECSTGTPCVWAGEPLDAPGGGGVSEVSADGGLTWTRSTLPSGAVPAGLVCPAATACWATDKAAVLHTTDGGVTWQRVALPADIPGLVLSQMSCPTADTCWISGEQAVPQVLSNGINGGSPIILNTADAGVTWDRTTPALPTTPPELPASSFMDIGQLACPEVGHCIGLGTVEEGVAHAPVYRVGS